MKRILFVILTGMLSSITVYSQFKTGIFPVHDYEQKFLRYNTYYNEFDSAGVIAKIGEFTVNSGGNTLLIPLQFSEETRSVTGSSNQGIDSILMNAGFSKSFILPSSSCSISFFRWYRVVAIPPNSGKFKDTIYTNNSYDQYWNVGVGKVIDTSIFVVRLVRSSNNSIIATIDSVGVVANLTTTYLQRFGTNPDSLYNMVSLTGLPTNDSVRFQIVPIRHGSTPYGMAFHQEGMWVNHSALVANSNGEWKLRESASVDTLNTQYYNKICTYYDSCISANGKLPLPLVYYVPKGYNQLYYTRYFDSTGVNNGITYYSPKHPVAYFGKKGNVLNDERETRVGMKSIVIKKIYPLSGSPDSDIKLDIDNQLRSFSGYIDIIDINGTVVLKHIWHGELSQGINTISFQSNSLTNGMYIARLHHINSNVLSSMKFVR